jgi:glucokinase
MINHSRLALVGAIGGTYISLALADIDELTVSDFALLNAADFKQPMDAIERYLTSIPRCPNKVGLSIAGSVAGDRAEFAHRKWSISKNDVRAATRADHVTLINDFEALALAAPVLTTYDLNEIRSGKTVRYGNKVIIGAGTGLGVAALVHHGDDWVPLAGEGGHVAFPAQPAGEFSVAEVFPRSAFISANDVFSGRGLVATYDTLVTARGAGAASSGARAIAAAGLSREDPIAAEALDLMVTWLGRFAGDVALTCGARGGVYLAGGLAANIVPALRSARFLEAFGGKGALSPYLADIPINAVKTGADAGLKGAALAVARALPAATHSSQRTAARR